MMLFACPISFSFDIKNKTSQQMKPLLKVDINFHEASKEWRKNKHYEGSGRFSYICGQPTKAGSPCQNKPMDKEHYCRHHLNHSIE
jgi:hypothetical protein